MNLILDFGNTITKVAVFSGEEALHTERISQPGISYLSGLFSQYKGISRCIISAVGGFPAEFFDYLANTLDQCIELDYTTPLPITNLYKTPTSLGYDRIAGVVAASSIFPGSTALVIDAGSAITYDLINDKAEFTGGNISPGATMRAKALNSFTQKLPFIKLDEEFNLLGNSTETAINSGILNGILFEMDSYIDRLKEIYPELKVILTGGDTYLFDKKLKNHIFVDLNLNLKGLNRILLHNAIK